MDSLPPPRLIWQVSYETSDGCENRGQQSLQQTENFWVFNFWYRRCDVLNISSKPHIFCIIYKKTQKFWVCWRLWWTASGCLTVKSVVYVESSWWWQTVSKISIKVISQMELCLLWPGGVKPSKCQKVFEQSFQLGNANRLCVSQFSNVPVHGGEKPLGWLLIPCFG